MSTSLSSLADNLSEIKAEIKTVNQHAILLGLKIIGYVTNAKNVEKSS